MYSRGFAFKLLLEGIYCRPYDQRHASLNRVRNILYTHTQFGKF